MSARRRRVEALAFALAAFLLFVANGREISGPDTYPTRYLPRRILMHGDLDLAAEPFFAAIEPRTTCVVRRGAALRSASPIGTAVLATPVYAASLLLGRPIHSDRDIDLLAKLAAAVLVAGAVAATRLSRFPRVEAAPELGPRAAAALLAIATPAWSVASQGLWPHTGAIFASALALAAASRERWLAAGLAAGLAVGCRAPMVLPFALFAPIAIPRWRGWLLFAAGAIAAAAPFLAYNYFGTGVLAGYNPDLRFHPEAGVAGLFGGSLRVGLAGLLLSPSRGLAVFSPWLLLAAWGALSPARRAEAGGRFGAGAGLAALALLLLYAKFHAWSGGWCFGPRYLTDLVPFAVVLAVPPLLALARRGTAGRAAALLLVLWSVAVQVVGAFRYDVIEGNAMLVAPGDDAVEPFWRWRQSQLLVVAHSGWKAPGIHGHHAASLIAVRLCEEGRPREARDVLLRALAEDPSDRVARAQLEALERGGP
jgi:hypothetical protein